MNVSKYPQPYLSIFYTYFKKDNSRYHSILIEGFSPIELCGEVIMSRKGARKFGEEKLFC